MSHIAATNRRYKGGIISVGPLHACYDRIQDALSCHRLEIIESLMPMDTNLTNVGLLDNDYDYLNTLKRIFGRLYPGISEGECIYCHEQSVPYLLESNEVIMHCKCFHKCINLLLPYNDRIIKCWRVNIPDMVAKYGFIKPIETNVINTMLFASVCIINDKCSNKNISKIDKKYSLHSKIHISHSAILMANLIQTSLVFIVFIYVAYLCVGFCFVDFICCS